MCIILAPNTLQQIKTSLPPTYSGLTVDALREHQLMYDAMANAKYYTWHPTQFLSESESFHCLSSSPLMISKQNEYEYESKASIHSTYQQ